MPSRSLRVLMDVDTGADDALAILLASKAREIDLIGVSTVVGNGPVEVVTEATLQALDAAEAPSELRVAKGCSRPILEEVHFAPFIHGSDCIGDLQPPLPKTQRKLVPDHAVPSILKWLSEEEDGSVTVVALAPLTNIAMALRLEEDLCKRKMKEIWWMGGAVRQGGNFKPWAEANAAYDPEAAAIVFNSGISIWMYPWDVYLEIDWSREELSQLGFMEENVLSLHPSASLALRLMFREMRQWKKETAALGDAGTVAALLLREAEGALEVDDLHVRIELAGGTRGMTVADLRKFVDPPDLPQEGNNVKVVRKLNPEIAKRLFSRLVLEKTD